MSTITAHNISKKYELYPKPRHRLFEWLTFGKKKFHRDFWALKDISFTLEKGKTLGVIGPNGAGKTTLLKIITGTTYPTMGELYVQGKVSSLLELGAGFHPEFTGRENIYMNASILGLSQREIDNRFDDIVDFSELNDFIDQPVKTYSSGMYMRLGFSVAVSVDPDILIVDEVLAVGDQNFQKKCMDKINSFRNQDKTILFCSHSMAFVRVICDEVLWLDHGEEIKRGDPILITDEYMSVMRNKKKRKEEEQQHEIDRTLPYFSDFRFKDDKNELNTGDDFRLFIDYIIPDSYNQKVNITFVISRNDNIRIFSTATFKSGLQINSSGTVEILIPEIPLMAGEYYCHLFLTDESNVNIFDKRRNIAKFTIAHEGVEMGIVNFSHEWKKIK